MHSTYLPYINSNLNKQPLEVLMRKAITMIVVLALGVSLWAESSPTRPSKNDVEIRFPDRRPSDDRTETYELYMVDS